MSRRYKQLEDNRLEHRVIMEDALGFKLPKEFKAVDKLIEKILKASETVKE